jgi:hypothetical protein
VQRHAFHPGDHKTWRGEPLCESCGSVEADKIHEVPVLGHEARVLDARRIGEQP